MVGGQQAGATGSSEQSLRSMACGCHGGEGALAVRSAVNLLVGSISLEARDSLRPP